MDSSKRSKVLLIGWDSVSRGTVGEMLESRQLPDLRGLIESGVIGTTSTRGPLSAGVIYNSVATGKYADAHGVLGPYEAHADGTVAKTASRSRRAKAFWEILSQNDRRCNVVNFPATGPAEHVNGVFVGPAFFVNVPSSYRSSAAVPPDSVFPPDRLDGLKEFIVSLEEIDAQTMALFVPLLGRADPQDERLGQIAAAIAQALSVHAVATWLMEHTEWDVMSVNYPAIEQLAGRFLRYGSPRLEWVDSGEHELFKEVATSSVRLCDLLLRRLLELAGDDAAVVLYSARGYRPHDRLPREALTSGQTIRQALCGGKGIFAMRAAGARADELIHNVTSLDICPTVLHLAGIAPGADMDGHVLADAFAEGLARLEPVESWETVPPARQGDDARCEPLDWTKATGLFAPYSLRRAWCLQTDNDWNLVRVLIGSSRRDLALPLLVRQYYGNPLQVDKATIVAEALYLAGLVPEALAVMAPIAESFPDWPIGQLMSGLIASHRGEVYRALDFFEQAGRDDPQIPQLFFYLGQVCMLLDRLPRAEQAYRRAIGIDPDFYYAHVGLSDILLRRRDFQGAADAALGAVGVAYSFPAGHLALGRAVAELGQMDRAEQAFRTALEFDPANQVVQAHLAAAEQGKVYHPPTDGSADQTGEPSVGPGEARKEQVAAAHAAVQQGYRDIAQWHGRYVEDLAAADARLDEYLAANAAARDVQFAPGDDSHTAGEADDTDWTIRPPLPADQPSLHQVFEDIFDDAFAREVFVIHPAGTDDIRGAVTMSIKRDQQQEIKLTLSVRAEAGATQEGRREALLMTRLLRAAVARAAAGGARRVIFSLNEEPGRSALRGCLERLSFEVALMERVETMDMLAFRDRCLRIVRRCERRQAIPEDVRLVPLGEVPYERVDEFLHTFFEDGAGVDPAALDQSISRVMLKGDQIIASMVGYTKGPDTFVVARSCVHADYRQLWATPWLHGDAFEVGCDVGLSVAQFCTDEARYPESVKIARRMGAKEIGRVYTMALHLAIPWPDAH